MKPFTLAPLRLVAMWRNGLEKTAAIHPELALLWRIFGPVILFAAGIGRALALLVAPSLVLSFSLAFTSGKPGTLWNVFAIAVILFWTLVVAAALRTFAAGLRQRIIDLEQFVSVLMMLLSYAFLSYLLWLTFSPSQT